MLGARMRAIVVLCLVLVGCSREASAEAYSLETTPESITTTGYKRGRAFKLRLVAVDWTYMEARTARAFSEMKAAAADAGIELSIRSGFRTHERQQWLYAAWRAGYGNRAARPGFSKHESGSALDLTVYDSATRGWLTANAQRFGFKRTVSDEPWHFEYVPVRRHKEAKLRKRLARRS